jgi:hypothetical protein
MSTYNPLDWYWIVGGDLTKVYSSAAGDYVPVDAPAYVTFKDLGGVATPIASAAELGQVLSPYSLRPVEASVLDGYQEAQSNGLVIQVNFKVLFNILKRLAVLEGKAAPTAAQARALVKSLL